MPDAFSILFLAHVVRYCNECCGIHERVCGCDEVDVLMITSSYLYTGREHDSGRLIADFAMPMLRDSEE